MKIRSGFVSNSSSSSFVLGKHYMTKEQIDKFNIFIDDRDKNSYKNDECYVVDESDIFGYDTCICTECNFYFHGDIDYRDIEKVKEFLMEIGVDIKYITLCD